MLSKLAKHGKAWKIVRGKEGEREKRKGRKRKRSKRGE